jgi:hypothetical protein
MIKPILACAVIIALGTGNAWAEQEDEPGPDATLEQAAQGILTANPKSIISVRKDIIESSAARRTPILDTFDDSDAPLDIEETFTVSSSPDSKPPIINIAKYMSSSVNFVDAYGKPWPIKRQINFMKGWVTVVPVAEPEVSAEKDTEGASNAGGIDPMDPQAGSLNITAMKHGVAGNVTIYLVGRSQPVTLALDGKSAVYHREATIKINEVGPQTDLKKINRGDEVIVGAKTDPDLNNALYGVGPVGSQLMSLEGGEGRAWLKGSVLYVQTPLSIFSPKVIGVTHANGRNRAYKLAASPTVMASNDEGKTITLHVKRRAEAEIFTESLNSDGH